MHALGMIRANLTPRRRISTVRSREVAKLLLDGHRKLIDRQDEASNVLFRMIGESDGAERRFLIQLRRDLHNERSIEDLTRTVPVVNRVLEARRSVTAVKASVGDARADEQHQMKSLLAGEQFRAALALHAPSVLEAADRYISAAEVDTRLAKSERGLLQYLTRAQHRTSPLGRFTAAGLAEVLTNATSQSVIVDVNLDDASATSSIDRSLARYILSGSVETEVTGQTRLALTTPLRIADGRAHYFRVAEGVAQRVALSLTDPVAAVIDMLAAGPMTAAALAAAVTRRFNLADESPMALLRALVDRSVVLQQFDSEEMADAAFIAPNEASIGPAGTIQTITSDLTAIASTSDPSRRVALVRSVTQEVERLAASRRRPVKVLINEDVRLPDGTINLNPAAAQDLALTLQFETAFDRMHDVRELLAGAFIDLYGRDAVVPLADVAQSLVDAVYRREAVLDDANAHELGGPSGSLPLLRQGRAQALNSLLRHINDRVVDDVVTINPDWYATLIDPSVMPSSPAAYAVVLQSVGNALTWNDAYAGNSMLLTRLTRWGEDGAAHREAMAQRLGALYGVDAAVSEDRGLHGVGLNNRPQVLPRAVDGDEWLTMTLSIDADSGSAVIRDAAGDRLNVLALGSEWPELYPAAVRVATWTVNSGRLVTDLASEWMQWRARGGNPVTATPEIRIGSVIRSRRRWAVDPTWTALRRSDDFFSGICRWRASTGAPAELFLKTPLPEALFESMLNDSGREAFFRERQRSKPQYLDLESVLMVDALPKWLSRRGPSYLEEAAPNGADGGHAVEFVVELSAVDGMSFGSAEQLQ